jgi:hypothetical protein
MKRASYKKIKHYAVTKTEEAGQKGKKVVGA